MRENNQAKFAIKEDSHPHLWLIIDEENRNHEMRYVNRSDAREGMQYV